VVRPLDPHPSGHQAGRCVVGRPRRSIAPPGPAYLLRVRPGIPQVARISTAMASPTEGWMSDQDKPACPEDELQRTATISSSRFVRIAAPETAARPNVRSNSAGLTSPA